MKTLHCCLKVYLSHDDFPNWRQTGKRIQHPVSKFWWIRLRGYQSKHTVSHQDIYHFPNPPPPKKKICVVKPFLGLSTPPIPHHISKYCKILRIDGDGIIDDVIMQCTWRHLCKKVLVDSNHHIAMVQNVWKRCCWHCNIWGNVSC